MTAMKELKELVSTVKEHCYHELAGFNQLGIKHLLRAPFVAAFLL